MEDLSWLTEGNYSGEDVFIPTIGSFIKKNRYPKKLGVLFDFDDIVQEVATTIRKRNLRAIEKARKADCDYGDWTKMSMYFVSSTFVNQAHIDIIKHVTRKTNKEKDSECLDGDIIGNCMTDIHYMNGCLEEKMSQAMANMELSDNDIMYIERILNKTSKKQADRIITKLILHMADNLSIY